MATLVKQVTPRLVGDARAGASFAASTVLPGLTAKLWLCPRWSVVEPLLQSMQFSAATADLVTHLQQDRRLPPGRGARVPQLRDPLAFLPSFMAGESIPCSLPADPQRSADFLPCDAETAGQFDFQGEQTFRYG